MASNRRPCCHIPWDVERTYVAVDTSRMIKKPEPPAPVRRWTIYKIAARQILIGTAEVGDETEAIEKGQLRPADDPCGGLRHQR